MKKFTVYYKILNSKFRSEIKADSQLQAEIKLKESLKIIKTVELETDPVVENLKNMFGIK
jgi:hypothetical protein